MRIENRTYACFFKTQRIMRFRVYERILKYLHRGYDEYRMALCSVFRHLV